MWPQLVINFFLILMVYVLQTSFFNNLIYPFNHFNLLIAFVFFVLSTFQSNKSYYWAIISGILLEIDSYYFLGTTFISLLLALILIDFIGKNFVVNKSYFGSFVLVVGGGFFFQVFLFILNYLLFLFGLLEFVYLFSNWLGYLAQFLFYSFFAFTAFFFVSFWNKKIGHYFIYS